jgi:hypothetical protein
MEQVNIYRIDCMQQDKATCVTIMPFNGRGGGSTVNC